MNRSLSLASLVVTLLLASGPVLARCGVYSSNPVEKDSAKSMLLHKYTISDVVFAGRVTALAYVPDGESENLVIRLAPETWWKGEPAAEVTLWTRTRRSATGQHLFMEAHDFQFEMGKKYLVYSRRINDRLSASRCYGTRDLELATQEITLLDALKGEQR